jgi:uncharacterized protein YaeQ
MALTATVYTFTLEIADVDRAVYETVEVKAACHPSETPEYLVTRVLAYALEYTEGLAFSKGGLSNPDEPALAVRDLTGSLTAWIEVGTPDAARLHKAAKASPRVAVYAHKDPRTVRRMLAGERIHRAEALELYAVPPGLIDGLVEQLDRRNAWSVSSTERHLYVTTRGITVEGAIERFTVEEPTS